MRPKAIDKLESAVQDCGNFEILEEFRGIFEEQEENSRHQGRSNSDQRDGKPTLEDAGDNAASNCPAKTRSTASQVSSTQQGRVNTHNEEMPETLPERFRAIQNCVNEDEKVLNHMPNALIPIRGFAHHFSPQFNPHDFFLPGFFTTYRGLKQALDIVQNNNSRGQGLLRDQLLYNEIGARGGTIQEGRGEHATELKSFFNDNERDPEFWEELKRAWLEGPWADWPVDENGNEFVPDPRRA
ncbi:MAG: hypothetical protein Q9160_002713 [Pyrenula sp. 1 TL-2023]